MTHHHEVRYLVTVSRNNHVRHKQIAETRAAADQLAARFMKAPGAVVDITELHDFSETDLTSYTREIVDDLQSR